MLLEAAGALRASPDDDNPAMTDPPPKPRIAASRAGKTPLGAFLDKDDVAIIQELCIRLGRERGTGRMTMQEFAVLAFTEKCERHGVKLTGRS
jgi:hypothetical protein